MEMPKSLEEIRKDIQTLNKEIDMLEKLIERETVKDNPNKRQIELFEKSLEEHKTALSSSKSKEQQIVDSINKFKERGIIADSNPQCGVAKDFVPQEKEM